MWDDNGYAYAKASWIIGKSFLGKRISSLSGIHTLSELDRLIFPEQHKELPGRELLIDLEKRIVGRAVRQILSVVNSYSQPPKLLVRMLKGFEYSDLKECLGSIAGGKTSLPLISDIGRFGSIRFDAYPDVSAMLKKTEYEHLLSEDQKSIKKGMDLTVVETKLDYRFYQSLIESLSQLDPDDREIAARLLSDEISLRNCLWALRLRTYYHRSESEVSKYLMDFKQLGKLHQKRTSLTTEARASLAFSLDVRKDWRGWRWERFLNHDPYETSYVGDGSRLTESVEHWKADPRHFQNAASQYLYHLCLRNFHSSSMSVSAIYCFIKLKQFEEDLLTSVAEGLSLGMDSSNVFKLLEVA